MSLNCSRIFIKMLILSLLLAVLVFSVNSQAVAPDQRDVVSLPESSTGALTATRYMLYYCKHHIKTLQLNGSLILELSNNVLGSGRDVNYEHCELKVRVEASKHILLQFFRLEIADTHGTPDRLKVFDNLPDASVLLTPKHGAYGYFPDGTHRGVRDYNSTYNELKLNYFGQPTRSAPGFKLLLTPFKREIARNKCPEGYFHCSIRHICIDSSLACDGYPNCGSKDESDEGKCSYYAKARTSTSFFQGPTLLVFVVCVVAIIAFLGITLVICLLTRYFNKSSIMKLRQAKRKRRRTQEYTSTNDLTQSYDPPSYEDVVRRRSADPPSYNITTPDTEDEAGGAGCGGDGSGGGGGSDDKLVNNRRLRNNVNTKNINIYNNTHSKNNASYTNNMSSAQPRNKYENLVQSGSDGHHGEEEQPLRSGGGDHVYSCSVMIESPVSSSRARYSHRINNSNRNSSGSSSSSNNMSDSNEFLLDTNGGSRGRTDVLASRLSNGGSMNGDEKLNGAVGCSPMATSSPGLYPAATDSSITPCTAAAAAAAAAAPPPGAAVVFNGTHNDNFNPRRSYLTTAAIGNDSEGCDDNDDDDDDDGFSQHGNLLSNIEKFRFADVEASPKYSSKTSCGNRNSSSYDNGNNIFCDLNSVNFNTDNNNERGSGGAGGNSVSGARNGTEAKTSPGVANGIGEVNGTKNDIVTPRTNEEGGDGGGGMMKMHRNRTVEESEVVTPQPESVRLLQ